MSKLLVPPVEARGIGAQEPFHAGYQVGFWRFNHQMKVIGHQAIRVQLPIGFIAAFTQCGKE
jgi:hypothetical protein